MKIEFPLYLVIDPGPTSEMADVCNEIRDFANLENAIIGTHMARWPAYQTRNPALYTDKAEAEQDGRARLAQRDAEAAAAWVPLSGLRPGAVFVTKGGTKAVKTAYTYDYGGEQCVLLDGAFAGEFGHFVASNVRDRAAAHNATLVREVKL
jgi:hypothetical protein